MGERIERVRVRAPARLHFGFLDLSGALGRRFGSLGLAIEGVATEVELRRDAEGVEGPEAARAARHLAALRAAWGIAEPVAVRIREAIPAHAGLGSGTQLGLAIGAGLARLFGRSEPLAAIAGLLERGARSAIGLEAFAGGGFLVDGGRAPEDRLPPPLILRLPFPEAWRILLVFDPARQGVHGAAEKAAFASFSPERDERAGSLCRLVLLRLLPGLVRAEFAPVAEALAEIQRAMGERFAAFQGGGAFASPAVAEVLARLGARGVRGVGQTSWGPTGWALFPDVVSAEAARIDAERRFAASGLRFRVVAGRNRPAEILAFPSTSEPEPEP
ncbi:MAG: GHMP kinase [Geminicoccaceae bacterium]|nr:GHMP kinase [Geminicoccaceae bacterium]MDW8125384.1 GHMP kinase [Geminicoccaceae bacterium]MDW8341689.1 GHMP kinase [Geminicoccaceae bacterium]MDW8444066.1 GHMP kinase [Acetobacteraceae bacterium]